jgi:DNA modification methylase
MSLSGMDPFLGSDTTAEVALHNKRKIIGFEIKEESTLNYPNKIAITSLKQKPTRISTFVKMLNKFPSLVL